MSRPKRAEAGPLLGGVLAIGILLLAQLLEGGHLRTLLQPTAALVVFGGTLAALLLSFPLRTLWVALRDVRQVFVRSPPPAYSVAIWFTERAVRVRRSGMMSLEASIGVIDDAFLNHALELAVEGLPAEQVRQVLEQRSRALEDMDDDSAEVFEAAAGYSPTLGILGAVMGLIQVMENLATPNLIGTGIAIAFVATIYGVAAANLAFLPIATRMRGSARAAGVHRALIIEGTMSLQRGLHPRLVASQLSRTAMTWPAETLKPRTLQPSTVVRS